MKLASACVVIGILGMTNLNCKQDERPAASQPSSATAKSPVSHAPAPTGHMTETAATTGTVLETMDAAGYTYVRLQTGQTTVWAAGPQTPVKVGQTVQLVGGMLMQDFHSKTLDRTFDNILFVTGIVTPSAASAPAGLPPQHPSITEPGETKPLPSQAVIRPGSIPMADGGFTVAELYGKKKDLAGKRVSVRAKVVKSSPNIMGKNWLHVQDGTGDAETCDVTVTTKDIAKVGDIVVVSGMLTTDKDIGSGYFFPLIIENAEVKADGQPSSRRAG
jgi:hypothetical protein